jgi:hypothetical protein
VDAHHGFYDGGAGRVDGHSRDGAGIAQRLSQNPMRESENEHTQSGDSENSSHGSSIGRVPYGAEPILTNDLKFGGSGMELPMSGRGAGQHKNHRRQRPPALP